MAYELIDGGNIPIKSWTIGVPFEEQAKNQLRKLSQVECVGPHIAVMSDVHFGFGATVGSVIPTIGAIIPSAVGVDIGCGITAVKTTLTASQLPDNLSHVRSAIEKAIPHGRSANGGTGDVGAWSTVPDKVLQEWGDLYDRFKIIEQKHKRVSDSRAIAQLGTLGGGNHFYEICLDEKQFVWITLHSGSRGVGNRIGTYFIEIAKREMERLGVKLPDRDLAYLREGSEHFNDYVEAVAWAQDYARVSRDLMLVNGVKALQKCDIPRFRLTDEVISCHHNYLSKECHFGKEIYITRKGAVSARDGELACLPGSMGTETFIVKGKGNLESFCSCSHGAGRVMSRGEAKRTITLAMHRDATNGVECRKDKDVLDESPAAYKDIKAVIQAQSDLIDVVHTLKAVVCIKG